MPYWNHNATVKFLRQIVFNAYLFFKKKKIDMATWKKKKKKKTPVLRLNGPAK